MSATTPAPTAQPLVLVSWDGAGPPLQCLLADTRPRFELLPFDHSGRHAEGPLWCDGMVCQVLSAATECKGEIYAHLARWLAQGQSRLETHFTGIASTTRCATPSRVARRPPSAPRNGPIEFVCRRST